MNLYLISQPENSGYDTYDSAVVAAGSEEEAAKILPGAGWADSPEQVEVRWIGIAEDGVEAGEVICASFNAG